MIEVLDEGDIAAGIKGRAWVVCEQMNANCNLAVVMVGIEEIKRDNSPVYLITQGVRTRLREETFLLPVRQIMTELRSTKW